MKIAGIIRKHPRILKDTAEVGHLFKNNILISFENDGNFAQHVIRSHQPEDGIPGTCPCGRSSCKTCNHILNT